MAGQYGVTDVDGIAGQFGTDAGIQDNGFIHYESLLMPRQGRSLFARAPPGRRMTIIPSIRGMPKSTEGYLNGL
jgi:hypothetical protein